MARMARAVGNGKPGAAVEIRYDFASKPAVGTPTELQIAFVPNAGVDALDVVVSGMDGVTLAGTLSASFTEVEPAKPYMHTVSVLPDRGGVFYLSVVATTQIGNSEPEPHVLDPVRRSAMCRHSRKRRRRPMRRASRSSPPRPSETTQDRAERGRAKARPHREARSSQIG